MQKQFLWPLTVLLITFISSHVLSAETESKFKEYVVIESILTKNSSQVVLMVDGLCCKNCAIGIGKKVRDLDFVDIKKLKKGVQIDRLNGLLTVAIQDGKDPDLKAIYKAIQKAGYKPTRLYRKSKDGKIKMEEVPAK